MKAKYNDIKNRIRENPKWFDTNGTPRYDNFNPCLSPNIYADEVVLLKISCQACDKEFLVEMNWNRIDEAEQLSKQVKEETIHYGDPPGHRCIGTSMNCMDLKVIEFWEKETKRLDWIRKKELEIKLPDAGKGGESECQRK